MPNDPIHLETDAPGLSGLALGSDGSLWAIPEERRELLRIDRETGAVTAYPIEGLPEGVEAEALSYRGNGEFLVGTETDGIDRPTDYLYVLDFDGSVARVRESYECSYELWGLQSDRNRGLEGLCTVGDAGVIVAAEVTGSVRGRRYAPLAWRTENGEWSPYRVFLSSETGKLAGITCRASPDGSAEVIAVERHFGVTRILGFELPPPHAGEPVSVRSEVLVNLDDWVRSLDQQPNFEGIARLDDDRVALLVDNQYRGLRTGPSALWIVTLDP
ncbi:MAG: hypothetical protein JJ863_30135 [Deltaproteobacteria bacterium]|nr:hypothetical protein [Deltaproteobacteria bacterium]